MGDSKDPIKEAKKPYFLEIGEQELDYKLELAPNEFNNYDDSLGLFQTPPKTLKFLTVEREILKIYESNKGA